MWKNPVERDRPQMTIWRMHIACWMFKATNAHSEYVLTTYCLSTVTIDAQTRPSVTLYVHCLSCSVVPHPIDKQPSFAPI